jgi:putative transposase
LHAPTLATTSMPFFSPEIHQRKSTRLTGYDYSAPGFYFITICLENIRCVLAGWDKGNLINSDVGETAKKYWMEIPVHYPNALIDAFVIMPDHLHGILHICEATGDQSATCRGVLLNAPAPDTSRNSNSTMQPTSTGCNQHPQSGYFSEISSMGGTRSVIIRNYKSAVRNWCNKNGFPQFRWQRGFYDRIIRDESGLEKIRWYIHNNSAALQEQYPGLK